MARDAGGQSDQEPPAQGSSRLPLAAILDLRSLALCRMGAGLVMLADLASRIPSFRLHYTDQGILPRGLLYEISGLRFPTAYTMSGWDVYIGALMLLHAAVALTLAVGYRTRLSGFLAWYLTVSLQERCFLANNGGDRVLATLLFWGMFLPWGEALSVDSEPSENSRADWRIGSMVTLLFLCQPVEIYLISLFHKIEPTWLRGEVLHYALQSDFYAYPLAFPLLAYPLLLKALAYATLVWEGIGPGFLLSANPRLRLFACLAFSVMHLSFGLFLRIGIFAVSPILYMVGLLPSLVWRQPFMQRLADGLEKGLGALRRVLPRATWRPVRPGPWCQAALLALFLYATVIAVGQGPKLQGLTSERTETLAHLTGMHQRWSVFVDTSRIFDGWVVVEAHLSDGRQVDLFAGRQPIRWEKPATPFQRYTSFRWATPLAIISEDPRLQKPFVLALAKDWQRDHPKDKVSWARLVLFREQPWMDYKHPSVLRKVLWEGNL